MTVTSDFVGLHESQAQPGWKACVFIVGLAVTIDVLVVQSPLAWLGIAAVLAIAAQFRSPMSGLAVVIFTCGLLNYSPFEVGALSRLYAGDVAIAIFLIAWYGRHIPRSLRDVLQPALIRQPLLVIALIAILSMLWSRLFPDPAVTYSFPHSDVSWSTAQLSQLALLAATICMPFAVAASIKSWKNVEAVVILLGIVVAIGTLLTCGALIFGFGGSFSILGATRGYWEQPWDSSIAPLSALLFPFLYAGVLFGRGRLSAYSLVCVLFALCLLGVVISFSRECWLLACLGLVLVSAAWLRGRVVALIVVVFPLILIVSLVIGLIAPGAIGLVGQFYNPNEVYGLDRVYFYLTGLQLFVTHPLMGVGAGNYQFFDRLYAEVSAGGIAHNQFITVAAETGIPGLLVLLWFVFSLLRIRRRLQLGQERLYDSQYWVKAAGSAFVLLWIAECFFQEAFFVTAAAGGGTRVMTATVYPWILLGTLFAVLNLTSSEMNAQRVCAEGSPL